MSLENQIEICGTVTVPSCIAAAEGAPHIGVRVVIGTGEDRVIMAAWGCQTFASQMPFSLLLDCNSLPEGAEPTLMASYGVRVNDEQSGYTLSMPLDVERPGSSVSMDLAIPGPSAQPGGQGEPTEPAAIIELKHTLEIPEAFLQPQALLTLGVYKTQEDGRINSTSSYIGGTVLWPTQGTLALTTYLDGNAVHEDDQLQLRVAYYDPQTMTPYAGKTLRDLTLADLAEQDAITLRPPRRS
ncbi:hypothetical protein ACIP02_09830 [Pseudomonas sp. NPDC089408]|uniref:hypothetical protein n=1 Tax=Pseudomonas sp. NPDC089408 TaxID=3364465 RepID=UPI00381064FC